MNADIAAIYIIANHQSTGELLGGTGMGTARVYGGDVPQGEIYPVAMVDIYDSQPYDTKDGVSVVDEETVKVFCYAATLKGARDLSVEVRNALDGISGTYNSHEIEIIRYLRSDGQRIELTNRKLYLREMDFLVRTKNTPSAVVLQEDEGNILLE